MKTVRALLLTAALVLTTAKATAAEQCASSMAELGSAPEIQRILVSFGGHQNLQGFWKLSGLAGSFVQAKVKFENKDSSFWTTYNTDAPSQINVCAGGDHYTLKLVVLNPLDPNNKIMLIRPVVGQPDKLMISAHASKWKYVKFKRIQSIQQAKR